MTRRSSSRALAQEIYRERVAGKVPQAATPLPNPPPHTNAPAPPKAAAGGGREQSEIGGGEKESLTEKARALYEGAAVPVAEIAAAVGVSERTIYKYAQRGNWTPRYRWSAFGGRPRGARWRAEASLAPDFVPVRGAAGRFVRRADKDKPFATGLHAADPQAAARAKAACAAAEAAARQAEREAEFDALLNEYDLAAKGVHRALDGIIALQKRRAQHKGAKPPAADAWEQALVATLRMYMDWRREVWEEMKSFRHSEAAGG